MVDFERISCAYEDCIKRKRNKMSAMEFSAENLIPNLVSLLNDINNRTYTTSPSKCFVTLDPTVREIFAADFRDRIVQHFYIQEIEDILEDTLVDNTASCRKNKGVGYALEILKKNVVEVSNYGKKDCFYLKIDLSGYFMSLNRDYISTLFENLILQKYSGKYKEELLYLTPIIFKDDPTYNCIVNAYPELLELVPDRKSIFKSNGKGLAIGNLTAQAGSNLNLNYLDHYCIEDLHLDSYIRYVDDIIILHENRKCLVRAFFSIKEKLKESGQILNEKKTIMEKAYYGISFLGKITYPYGYQVLSKQSRNRIYESAKHMELGGNTLAKLNSRVGLLKWFASHRDLQNYIEFLPQKIKNKYVFINGKFIEA